MEQHKREGPFLYYLSNDTKTVKLTSNYINSYYN